MPTVTRLTNGNQLDVELHADCSVADARGCIAEKLGMAAEGVHLLAGVGMLSDAETIGEVDELTVVLSTGPPAWYPTGKYLHGGREVLRTVEERYAGQCGLEDKIVVYYTDNTSACFGIWHSAGGGRADSGQRSVSELLELTAQWRFETHRAESTWPGGKTTIKESVPVEDPSKWVRFKRYAGSRLMQGEYRKGAEQPFCSKG
mmetsp:Transcript_76365/g.212154  ORF Transcript_76365/g.212154 Transcript_76365/m.212154 type:complete len:203 (-) Transcript_76365:102-710(-)